MRFLAFFARHPLRNGLVLFAVAAVLYGGARLWTSGPDAMHITITHVAVSGWTWPRQTSTRVAVDRTILNRAIAQRLQREFAAIPLVPYSVSCPNYSSFKRSTDVDYYDAYTLTWYRAGLPVEQASADWAGMYSACWFDDGVFIHASRDPAAMFANIDAVVNASG
jgi:hypothetical protein